MRKLRNLKAYLTISFIAAAVVGAITLFGTRTESHAVIAALVTFIVMLVVIATLDLSVKQEPQDPNKPKLS
ncbi:MAG: hypothetical protein RLZZ579_424 [Actinomycetota bacterium]